MISAEQMLDAYSSVGMPLMYAHWSFGKRFARDETLYRKGYQALAYEIVINSNPCISYLHGGEHDGDADAGHRARGLRPQPFLQEQLSVPAMDRPGGILDYLDFAKRYVAACEERYGVEAVEADPRRRARADGPGRVPLSPRATS